MRWLLRTRLFPLSSFLLSLALSGAAGAQDFTLTILHTNDMHARVEPARVRGKLLGGYARLATLIKKFQREDPNPILVNGGDTFQGTLYFNVYEGLADLAFMNYVGFAAMAAGNHEFDRGPAVLGRFARGAAFPILAANLDVESEPELFRYIQIGSTTIAGGQRIGIVGAVTPTLHSISSPGANVKLKDLVRSVQAGIDAFTQNGIDKIIVLTHVGYREEIELVRKLKGVDVLVGGHSHTYCGEAIPDIVDAGPPYPTVTKNADGDTALVVQAWEWGKVLGRIKVTFDGKGRVKSWSDAKPILVDESIPEDQTMKSIIEALKRPIAELANKVVGQASSAITREGGYDGETLMGNLICDAMLEATAKQGSVAAFMNAGGIRANLEAGPITYGAAISVQPFNNTLVLLDLTGAELKAALESGLDKGFLHISKGSSYRFDKSRPAGQRVLAVKIAGQSLDPAKTYRVCLNSFIASGGDSHEVLKNAKGTRTDTGLLDIDALIALIQKHTPVNPKVEGRIGVAGQWSAELRCRPGSGAKLCAPLLSALGRS